MDGEEGTTDDEPGMRINNLNHSTKSHFIGRAKNIRELIADESFKTALTKSGEEPLIVAGDFNTPSHLDWTEQTKDTHCGWAFDWPTTKLMEQQGMIDSFREVHPDPLKEPGMTSTNKLLRNFKFRHNLEYSREIQQLLLGLECARTSGSNRSDTLSQQ